MKIDEQVEPLVRTALGAAVKRDAARLEVALDAFTDESKRRTGMELVIAIAHVALRDLYQGQTPSDVEVQDFADYIAEAESWVGLPVEDIRSFLLMLRGDPPVTFAEESAIVLVFVVTATMLSYKDMPEGQWWFNYLDQIEAALEALPKPAA